MDRFKFLDPHILPRTYKLPSQATPSTRPPAKSTSAKSKETQGKEAEMAQDNTSNWDADDDVGSQDTKEDPVGGEASEEDDVNEVEDEEEKEMESKGCNKDDPGDDRDVVSDGDDPDDQHTETGVGGEDAGEDDAEDAQDDLREKKKLQDIHPQVKEPEDEVEVELNKSNFSEQYHTDLEKLAKGRGVHGTISPLDYSFDNEYDPDDQMVKEADVQKIKKADKSSDVQKIKKVDDSSDVQKIKSSDLAKPSLEVGEAGEKAPTETEQTSPAGPYIQSGKCCVESHVIGVLTKMDTEAEINIT